MALSIDQLLTDLVQRDASDLHLKSGQPPIMRIRGELVRVPECQQSPEEHANMLLGILNDIVYDNVRHRMKQHEYVTLVLLRYQQHGKITYAGAHEELVLLRKGAANCEVLATPGTWVGASQEIRMVTSDSEVTLEKALEAHLPSEELDDVRKNVPWRGFPPAKADAAGGAGGGAA